MVKIGFIYDGETEKVILDSPMFKEFLNKYNFELAGIRKYTGGKIARDTNMLVNGNNRAEKVIIIKDLERLANKKALSTELEKKEIITDKNILVVVKK